ncbi:MAG: adenylate/guanylate cyclase domain-containing protein [Pseudanabaena sp. ELA607]
MFQQKQWLIKCGQLCKKHNQKLVISLITLSVSFGVTTVRNIAWLEQGELRFFDLWTRTRPAEKADDRIVLVEIGENDIQEQKQWPWSDRMFAKLINQISQGKPTVIGIDKYFDLPVPTNDPEGRQELVNAVKNANNVVNATLESVKKGKAGVALAKDLANISMGGFVNLQTDGGSLIVRRVILVGNEASFAFTIADQYLAKHGKAPDQQIKFDPKTITFTAGNQVIPRITKNYGPYRGEDTSAYQTMLLYRGKPYSFERVSASALLNGTVNPQVFTNRIVLVGVMTESVPDRLPTPYSESGEVMYGVEIHANIISQLVAASLDQRPFIRVLSENHEVIWIVLWTILGGLIAGSFQNAAKNMIILFLLSGLLFVAGWGGFILAWWLPILPSLIGLITANVLVMAYKLAVQQSERKLLMGLFSRHVSKELVNIIWDNREQFMRDGRIAGQEVYVTVLFTDMRNFSTAAEAQRPGETLTWLNNYLGTIATEVLNHGGMVDKYIGDAVMAVFGVPIPHYSEAAFDKDAQDAVNAALAIAQKLTEMNNLWVSQGLPEVVTGIGINSGIVIAGSLGSAERLEYSVLGDTVNIAARLESFNKEVDGGPHHILISEETLQRLDNKFKTEHVGSYALKGKVQETNIYRVMDQQTQPMMEIQPSNGHQANLTQPKLSYALSPQETVASEYGN